MGPIRGGPRGSAPDVSFRTCSVAGVNHLFGSSQPMVPPARVNRRPVSRREPRRRGYPGSLGFQYCYVSYAGFVQPGTIVDHQDNARPRLLERVEENVNTSDVPNWQRSTSTLHSGEKRFNTRRCKTYGNASAQTAVRQIWRGQPIELVDQCFVLSTFGVCDLLNGLRRADKAGFRSCKQPTHGSFEYRIVMNTNFGRTARLAMEQRRR